jgi:DNA-binding FrmR family transcriptional regulator
MRHAETRNGAGAAATRPATPPSPRMLKHSLREKTKLLNRVKRIRGQVTAVEDLIEDDGDCEMALHTLAACRGAINALMAEILEDHIRSTSSPQTPIPIRMKAWPPNNWWTS